MVDPSNIFVSVNWMLKAVPVEDGAARVIYCEASNETVDAQNEVVLQKALSDSMEYMLAKGNFDLDHVTMIGAKAGIPDYMLYEIGRPSEISFRDGRTFVKGFIYQGEGKAAERANYFWSSLTEVSPPAAWYPSVGGAVLERDIQIDPLTKSQKVAVSKVRWSNIGYTKQPVNQAVPSVQTMPLEVFAKCCTVAGCLDLSKALEAGYGTDSATLTEGGALRRQSLDRRVQAVVPATYLDVREALSKRMRKRREADPAHLVHFVTDAFHLQPDEAARWVERFLRDLRAHRNHGDTP
jgi:hypothetical protein